MDFGRANFTGARVSGIFNTVKLWWSSVMGARFDVAFTNTNLRGIEVREASMFGIAFLDGTTCLNGSAPVDDECPAVS